MMGLPGVLTGNHTMSQKLLDVFMLGRCAHEFSWPRRSSDGSYYQVCLLCAAEYKYDWKTMRRIERVEATAEPATKRRAHTKKPTWETRACCLKIDTSVLYYTFATIPLVSGLCVTACV